MSITEHISEHQTQETSHSFQTNNYGILQENSSRRMREFFFWDHPVILFITENFYFVMPIQSGWSTSLLRHQKPKLFIINFVSLKENLTPPRFGCIISHSFPEVTFWALIVGYNYIQKRPMTRNAKCGTFLLINHHQKDVLYYWVMYHTPWLLLVITLLCGFLTTACVWLL